MTKNQFSKEFLSKIKEEIEKLLEEGNLEEAQKLTDVYLINNEEYETNSQSTFGWDSELIVSSSSNSGRITTEK